MLSASLAPAHVQTLCGESFGQEFFKVENSNGFITLLSSMHINSFCFFSYHFSAWPFDQDSLKLNVINSLSFSWTRFNEAVSNVLLA